MQNIKSLAYRFLLEAQIKELNISISTLKEVLKKQNILILKYSELETLKPKIPDEAYQATKDSMQENDAISLATNNIIFILYSDDLSYGSKLQKIYHEIGHIKAEHNRSDLYTFKPNKEQEREADAFSFYAIAPPCVLKEIGISSTEDLSCLTGVNPVHARKLLSIIRRDKGNKSLNLEKNLLRQFEQFINANKSNNVYIKKYLSAGVVALTVCILSIFLYGNYNDKTMATATIPTAIPAVTTVQETPETKQATPEHREEISTSDKEIPTPVQETSTSDKVISATNDDDNTITVWKAKTGGIYHTDPDCYHIPKSAYPMELEEAINVGYRKCKDCKK